MDAAPAMPQASSIRAIFGRDARAWMVVTVFMAELLSRRFINASMKPRGRPARLRRAIEVVPDTHEFVPLRRPDGRKALQLR